MPMHSPLLVGGGDSDGYLRHLNPLNSIKNESPCDMFFSPKERGHLASRQ